MEQHGYEREDNLNFKFTNGINDCEIIEHFTSNKLSDLRLAIEVVSEQQHGKEGVLILTDMVHENTKPECAYENLQQILREKHVRRIICVGEEICRYAEVFTTSDKSVYTEVEELLKQDIYTKFNNAQILVSNASHPDMKQIVGALQLHTDRATIHVDLDDVKYNLDHCRSKLKPTTKMMIVMKASHYGTGNYELAKILQHHGADYYGVVCTSEGVCFRTHGITKPILIFNPAVESFGKVVHYNLEPTIYSLTMLAQLNEFVNQQHKCVNIHIKLETGMNRHGIEEEELDELITALTNSSPYVIVKGIYSHLCGQDDSIHDDYTETQANRFISMATRLEAELGISTLKHLIASGGIFRFPKYQFDMVRLGKGLQGIGMGMIQGTCGLRETLTFTTVISQVRRVLKGSPIGYDRTYVASDDIDVAVLDIGYGDGFKRSMGNGVGTVLIGSQSAHTVGRICMGLSMIDVTGLDVNVGDTVTIFDKSAHKMADTAGVFVLEMMVNMHIRVKRVFYASSRFYEASNSINAEKDTVEEINAQKDLAMIAKKLRQMGFTKGNRAKVSRTYIGNNRQLVSSRE